MARLLYVIPEADFRCRHYGLWELAKKKGVDPTKLNKGDIIAFLNNSKDMIAVIAVTGEADSVGVLAYYRSPHGRIEPHAIQFIPEVFGGGVLDMRKATAKALQKLVPVKRRKEQ